VTIVISNEVIVKQYTNPYVDHPRSVDWPTVVDISTFAQTPM